MSEEHMDLEIDKLLESDSDFIEKLCKQLEQENIHLTHELLVKILSEYEEQKFDLVRGFLEQLIGQEILPFEEGSHSIIQVAMSRKQEEEDAEEELLSDVDSEYLV